MPVHVTDRDDGVRVLTIDRPDRRNALDPDHVELLRAGVAGAPDGTRVLVVRGTAGHFCAGADLKGIEGPEFAGVLRGLFDALRDAPFCCIAAVEGAALGAGTQLAVACDLRTTTAGATFGIPAGRLGLMVDHWTVRRLVALAGSGPARAMLLAAETCTGADAHRLGLAQRVATVDEALAWAAEIAALAPLTVRGHKLLLDAFDGPLPDDPPGREAFARAWASADHREGVAAFHERRPPRFQGR